jgi:transcription antitermination factor NusG
MDRLSPSPIPPLVLPETVPEWGALRTRPHWEKRLAWLLGESNVPVFLPLMTRLRTYASKRRTIEMPVFGGYVFCSIRDFIGNRRLAPGVQAKVVRLLRAPNPEKLRQELRTIAELLADRRLVQERFAGKEGDRVRLVGTPFLGQVGTVLKAKPNGWRLVLEVSFLGVSCEVEVDERMVDRVL